MSSTGLEGFEYSRRLIGDCDYLLAEIGAGPVVLLLHDYRASFHLDQQHDIEDLQLGRRISAPTLVVVGEDEEQLADAYEIWDDWVEELSYKQVPGGHFLPEETPHELARAVREFLTA